MTAVTGDSKFGCAKWIVSPTLSSGATHTTIASALTAASSGDVIFIKPGTYTEDLTLKAGVDLQAFSGDAVTPNVSIVGKATATFAGTCTISGIRLTTNSDFFLVVSGSSATIINMIQCYLNVSNNTGISYTSSSSSSVVNMVSCQGNCATTGITYFVSSSAGTIYLKNSSLTNSGVSGTNSSASAGAIQITNSNISMGMTTTGTADLRIYNSTIDPGANSTIPVNHGGSGTNSIVANANLITGSAVESLTIGSGATLNVYNTLIWTSQASAITGAGTINYTGLSFRDTSTGDITTTTQNGGVLRPGVWRSSSQPAFLAWASGAQLNVTGDGTVYKVLFATEIFDQKSNFASSTFTAPYTGRYFLSANVTVTQLAAGHTSGTMTIVTSNNTYTFGQCNPGACMDVGTSLTFSGSVLADMDSADTAIVNVTITGATKVVDITNTVITNFSGYLAC